MLNVLPVLMNGTMDFIAPPPGQKPEPENTLTAPGAGPGHALYHSR